jgi:hypothetical protein
MGLKLSSEAKLITPDEAVSVRPLLGFLSEQDAQSAATSVNPTNV